MKDDGCWLVRVGDSCHVRSLQYFRVVQEVGSAEPDR
jgi:hypothetical protein